MNKYVSDECIADLVALGELMQEIATKHELEYLTMCTMDGYSVSSAAQNKRAKLDGEYINIYGGHDLTKPQEDISL